MTSRPSIIQKQVPYLWPDDALRAPIDPGTDGLYRSAALHENQASVATDSRWPAFFPSPIALVTSGGAQDTVLERVVAPMIVNRFPLTMAISLCREPLSERHYARTSMMAAIESSGWVATQFLVPGPALTTALDTIARVPDDAATGRLAMTRLATRAVGPVGTRVLEDAYLVYCGRLAQPGISLNGERIFDVPWVDVGSHRIYFVEIVSIHLAAPIARGERQIAWHSLPRWEPTVRVDAPGADDSGLLAQRYVKNYSPHYLFPSPGTVAFEADETIQGMAVRHLEPLASGQVIVDNERARWPCFFPSSVGMLTAWRDDGRPTAMPCGSSGIISRLPLTFAACISNSAINERYAPRETLATIRATGWFGVGVPYKDDAVVRAISHLGNVSARADADKVRHSGLTVLATPAAPILAQLPVHFECRITREIVLGTHVMVLGEVERIYTRRDVAPDRPLEWRPWATVP